MKGGKEEDKIMEPRKEEDKITEPLFPRLHVNDTDKGGPRAPPRNKMALYEQFSIPSHRLHWAYSSLPLPRHNACSSVPSNASSQGYGHERNGFPPIMPRNAPVHSLEKIDSQASDGIDHSARLGERSLNLVNSRNLNMGSVAGRRSLHNHTSKSSLEKRLDDAGDFRVPTFDQSETATCSRKDTPVIKPVNLTSFTAKGQQRSHHFAFNSSIQCSTSYEKPLEQINAADMKQIKFGGSQNGKKPEESLVVLEPEEKSLSTIVREQSNVANISDQASTRELIENSLSRDMESCQESFGDGDLNGSKTSNEIDVVESRDASQKSHRTLNMMDNGNQEDTVKENGTLKMGDAERKDEASEASMVCSITVLEISPDDVVGIIGPKHFWKARRAIINQQRVFAIQVFELHRLIKVQKLIAGSPHLLLEGNPYLSKSLAKAPLKVPLLDYNLNSQQHSAKQKDNRQKSDQTKELSTENIAGIPPLPTCEDEADRGSHCQALETEPCPENPPSISTAPDDKPSPWFFHPPANQWLVPVMSPSEGLIYKPYTGPCAPSDGFLAPFYGSCIPFGIPPSAGDFMNMAYGVPASHRPPSMGVLAGSPVIATNCFPTYSLPSMNPIVSALAVEQVSKLACSQHNGRVDQHPRNSCIESHPSGPITVCLGKFQASKDSELQGSSVSSPCKKAQIDARDESPFLTAPAKDDLTCPSQSSVRGSQTRVIKVVPRNAVLAAETAARIFQSIQEERLQIDL